MYPNFQILKNMIHHRNDMFTCQHDAKSALCGRMEFREGTELVSNPIYIYIAIKSMKSKSKMNLQKNPPKSNLTNPK